MFDIEFEKLTKKHDQQIYKIIWYNIMNKLTSINLKVDS